MFQFPSNGKAYPKAERNQGYVVSYFVSIPFKRESISKGFCNPRHARFFYSGFNSLQTGKHIQSLYETLKTKITKLKFQFPSNGKAYPKRDTQRFKPRFDFAMFQFPSNGKAYPKTFCFDDFTILANVDVSIPFKRESISKECLIH